MSRSLVLLNPRFEIKVRQLLEACDSAGYTMRPFFTLRTPIEQAKLWRQSRSTKQITKKIKNLERSGAPFLAHCLYVVGPQYGRWVTNAVPGLSWHQWGLAVDCFWLLGGKAEWSTRKEVEGKDGYKVYAAEAKKLGLTALGLSKSRDWVHVQREKESSPLKIYDLKYIDEVMERRFKTLEETGAL